MRVVETIEGASRIECAEHLIDSGWHPLVDGNPPIWASGWGQDEYGVWVQLTLAQVTQRLRWIPPGLFQMGSNDDPGWYGGNSGVGFELEEGHRIDHLSDRQFDRNPSGTHPVGQKRPNAWGLYDMLGNVWEWTADAWHESYDGAPADGSVWDAGEAGAERVIRGGSWFSRARTCRSACRLRFHPGGRDGFLGFRPARAQE